jgi:small subunit ribosomal protein S20
VANTSSAKKAVRTIARKTEQNKSIRTGVKTAIKKVAGAQDQAGGAEALKAAAKALDQAAAKGVIHKNKAARKKSRLAKKINKTA